MNQGRSYYKNSRPEMVQFLPAAYTKVLEVGCGEGWFSTHLHPGCEVWGVELDHDSVPVARRRLHRVLVGRYADVSADLPNDYFDLAICNDVIEHMPDHDWFLESIRDKLCAGGFLVGSIPNVRHIRQLYELMVEKEWRYKAEGVLDCSHLRFFTEKSLRRVLDRHAYTIERFNGINDKRDPLGRLLVNFIGLITLGYYSDIRYLQFGFRARKVAAARPDLIILSAP